MNKMNRIAAYSGRDEAAQFLVGYLQNQDHGGRSKSGLSVLHGKTANSLHSTEDVEHLISQYEDVGLKGKVGLGHINLEENQVSEVEKFEQPRKSSHADLVAVFAGELTNKEELLEKLDSAGMSLSERDEPSLILGLVDMARFNGLTDISRALESVMTELEGQFSLIILSTLTNERIVASQKASSLSMAVAEEGLMVSSDIAPFLRLTDKALFLNDSEILVIDDKNEYSISKSGTTEMKPQVKQVDIASLSEEKGSHKHFMIKELKELPSVVNAIAKNYLSPQDLKLKLNLHELTYSRIQSANRVIILVERAYEGSAELIRYWVEEYLELPAQVENASDFINRRPFISSSDFAIIISDSGEENSLITCLRLLNSEKAHSIALINKANSTIGRMSGDIMEAFSGSQMAKVPTKLNVASPICALTLIIHLAHKLEKMNEFAYWHMTAELSLLEERIQAVVNQADHIERIAHTFNSSTQFNLLGKGYNLPVCTQSSFFIEHLHHTSSPKLSLWNDDQMLLSNIEKGSTIIIFANGPQSAGHLETLHLKLRREGARLLAIINDDNKRIKNFTDEVIGIPKVQEAFSSILAIIPIQLLTYYMAIYNNREVDLVEI